MKCCPRQFSDFLLPFHHTTTSFPPNLSLQRSTLLRNSTFLDLDGAALTGKIVRLEFWDTSLNSYPYMVPWWTIVVIDDLINIDFVFHSDNPSAPTIEEAERRLAIKDKMVAHLRAILVRLLDSDYLHFEDHDTTRPRNLDPALKSGNGGL